MGLARAREGLAVGSVRISLERVGRHPFLQSASPSPSLLQSKARFETLHQDNPLLTDCMRTIHQKQMLPMDVLLNPLTPRTWQVGVFPEQFDNWKYIQNRIRAFVLPGGDRGKAIAGFRVMNGFGYTGGSTLAAAAASPGYFLFCSLLFSPLLSSSVLSSPLLFRSPD